MGVTRTLLADDSADLRRRIKELLAAAPDIEIVGEAANGGEAIRRTRQLRPDLVLMDVSMPGTNGIDATRRLKREMPQIQIIVLSGYDLQEYREGALSSGASGYVIKEVLTEALLPAIRDIRSRHEVQRRDFRP
jgi:DNA-binding NarL/FixJ family response regulator